MNPRRLTPDEAFDIYHRENPQVYRLFQRFARELRVAGHQHGSAEQIVQRIRWEYAAIAPIDAAGFKFNDWYRARYARMLARDFPTEFGDFFSFRKRIVLPPHRNEAA